jgi:hypothetical protein
MPTVIGVVFFFAGAYCFLRKQDNLFGLLIIATVFEASSAINIGDRGIQPYYVIAGFIIIRGAINWVFGIRPGRSMPRGAWLLIFGAIGVASAWVLPIVFAGTPIYDAKIGIDPGLFIRPPLKFGLNNVGQASFLAWHIATAYALLSIDFSPCKTRKAYIWAFYIVVAFVFAQSLFQFAGIPFPDSMIRNNPGYAMTDSNFGAFGTRNSGTFTEPSMAGAFLLFCCVGFTSEYLDGKGNAARVLIALAASGAVASSGSLLALALFLLALLIRHSPFRFPWHFNIRRARRLAWILLLLVTPLALVMLAPASLRETLITLTVAKGDSSSFVNRTAADLYALQLLAQTHGLGVGLGSNRASSLIPTLSSTVGLAGTLAFVTFCFQLFSSTPPEYAWLRWAAFALLFNMCISIADVTIPIFWIAVLLAVQLTANRVLARPKRKSGVVVAVS